MTFLIAVLTVCGIFFPILDPLGNLFPVQTLLNKTCPPKLHSKIIVREICFAFGILYVTLFCGGPILTFLHIDNATLQIAGGALLAITALSMIFPKESCESNSMNQIPYIVPIAVPLVAGPSAISVTILLRGEFSVAQISVAFFIMGIITLIIFLCGKPITKFLGKRGSVAVERLMGLLLIIIAAQMLVNGISNVALNINEKINNQNIELENKNIAK